MKNCGQNIQEDIIKEYVESHAQETLALLKELAVIPAPLGREEKRAAFVLEWLHSIGAAEAYMDGVGNVIFPYPGEAHGGLMTPSAAPEEKSGGLTALSVVPEGKSGGMAALSMDSEGKSGGMTVLSANSEGKSGGMTALSVDPEGKSGELMTSFADPEELHSELTVVTAHMDVVCPDTNALPLDETGDRLIGPGVRDDTANLVNMLMAIKFLLTHPGLQRNSFLFAADVGEEGLGNLRGSKEILRNFGGRIRQWISFDLNYDTMYTRAVGSRRYRITLRTNGGHSYSDFGEANAIHRLAELIAELYQMEVSDYPGKVTYNVGYAEGGTSVNTIAQEASMLFEFRAESEEVLGTLQNILYETIEKHRTEDVQIQTEVIGVRPGNGRIDPREQGALEQRCLQAIGSYYDGNVICTAGSTDCNIPLSAGIPAVTVGTALGAGTHTRGEWVGKESLKTGQAIALRLILEV